MSCWSKPTPRRRKPSPGPSRQAKRPKITRPQLVAIDAVRPSAYNPREADEERLAILELSLRRLGFVLPLFADPDGEILSGHQRHLVAGRIGLDQVPVVRVPRMSGQARRAFNLVFNRATNDLAATDDETSITARLRELDLDALAAAVPEKEPETFFPCVHRLRYVPIRPLLTANTGRWNDHARTLSRTLRAQGVLMPIVVGPGHHVVNGIGRLEMWAEENMAYVPVVEVSAEEAALSDAVLNLLSMDFALEERYADLLRHSAHRRARQQREQGKLGDGYKSEVCRRGQAFDASSASDRARWLRAYGHHVADLGAGFLDQTNLMRRMGARVAAFEPFVPASRGVDIARSRSICEEFLEEVSRGEPLSSIFLAFVLNSVPFLDDRLRLLRLAAALCSPSTNVYVTVKTTDHSAWKNLVGAAYANGAYSRSGLFKLLYEPGVTLGDIGQGAAPKVQKFHSSDELRKLLQSIFRSVRLRKYGSSQMVAVCSRPKLIAEESLHEAITFEFDLPYPDGSRLGLAERALEAFERRRHVGGKDHPARPQLHSGRSGESDQDQSAVHQGESAETDAS